MAEYHEAVKRYGRRSFLKGLVWGGVAVEANRRLGVLSRLANLVKGSIGPKEEGLSATGVTVEPSAKKLRDFSEFFANLTPNEQRIANEKVEAAKNTMSQILDKDSYLSLSDFENEIRRNAKNAKLPDKVGDLLIGLIATESHGDSEAVSAQQAAGLTQMSVKMAAKHKLSPQDRFIPVKILAATANELKEEHDLRYGEWTITLWSWHTGAENMYAILREYFRDQYRENLPSENAEDYEEAMRRINLYKNKIAQHNLNFFKILQSTKVSEMLSDKEKWDYTDEYIWRTIASAKLFGDYKKDILPQIASTP